jgi:hypothetical protein
VRAEQFIINKVGTLQPKKGESSSRVVRVFDVKASANGLLLEVCDADKAEHGRACGSSHAWVMAYRVEFEPCSVCNGTGYAELAGWWGISKEVLYVPCVECSPKAGGQDEV